MNSANDRILEKTCYYGRYLNSLKKILWKNKKLFYNLKI